MGGPLKSPKRGGWKGGHFSLFSLFCPLSIFRFSFHPFAPGTLAKREVTPFLFSLFPTLRLHIRAVAFMRRFQHQRWSFFITMGSVHISNDWE